MPSLGTAFLGGLVRTVEEVDINFRGNSLLDPFISEGVKRGCGCGQHAYEITTATKAATNSAKSVRAVC